MRYGIVAICILMLTGCASQAKRVRVVQSDNSYSGDPLPEGPAVLFIHGTKKSLASKLVHRIDNPLGMNHAPSLTVNSVLTRIAPTLKNACPEEYPLDRTYFFSWDGRLTFKSRKHAAKKLYPLIKNHKGPLTVITHSHGANVALYLAELAEQDGCCNAVIDRLSCFSLN